MKFRPQAAVRPAQSKAKQTSKKFGIEGKAFHVLFCLLFLRSVVATPHFNLSRGSLRLEAVEHLVDQLRRMNAVTFYTELIDRISSNVTSENMFLIQSIATCCSLGWCVCPSYVVAAREDTLTLK
jgi:hypothetical protein